MKKIVPIDAVLIPDQAQRVFKGIIYDVYHWPQQLFDDSKATFEGLKRIDTVGAYCIVDGKILVLDDEKPLTGLRLSFPGGRVDSTDSSILAAAQREVHEETGYAFNHWRLVSVRQPHTKIEWFLHYFLAWDVKSHDQPHIDAGERITMQSRDFSEVRQLSLDQVGYLGESKDLFERLNTLQDLLALPEFSGREVDR